MSYSTEGSPTYPLQRCDRCCVVWQGGPHYLPPCGHNFLLPDVQTQVQPTKPLEMTLRILHRARKPGHNYFIGSDSIQLHYYKPTALQSYQGGYPSSQPVSGLFNLAQHNGCPFGSVGIDKPGGEPLFRDPIHKPTDSPLDAYDIYSSYLNPRIVLTHHRHSNALPSGPNKSFANLL